MPPQCPNDNENLGAVQRSSLQRRNDAMLEAEIRQELEREQYRRRGRPHSRGDGLLHRCNSVNAGRRNMTTLMLLAPTRTFDSERHLSVQEANRTSWSNLDSVHVPTKASTTTATRAEVWDELRLWSNLDSIHRSRRERGGAAAALDDDDDGNNSTVMTMTTDSNNDSHGNNSTVMTMMTDSNSHNNHSRASSSSSSNDNNNSASDFNDSACSFASFGEHPQQPTPPPREGWCDRGTDVAMDGGGGGGGGAGAADRALVRAASEAFTRLREDEPTPRSVLLRPAHRSGSLRLQQRASSRGTSLSLIQETHLD